MPEVELRNEAREGRIGSRKEECPRFAKEQEGHKSITWAINEKQMFIHGWYCVTWSYAQVRGHRLWLISSTEVFQGINCQKSLCVYYLLFPQNVLLLHFLIFVKAGGRLAKFNLGVYSEKMALGAPSCLWRKQTERLPSPAVQELLSDTPLSQGSLCVTDWFSMPRVWEPQRRLE